LFKIHYLLQLLIIIIIIIIIVVMGNKIADPSVEYWVHSHSSSLNHIRSASYSWSTLRTNEIAIDPSPTADATRLMLPPRTSPTAKTPGKLVSSKYG
jgi:hypothetical protein